MSSEWRPAAGIGGAAGEELEQQEQEQEPAKEFEQQVAAGIPVPSAIRPHGRRQCLSA